MSRGFLGLTFILVKKKGQETMWLVITLPAFLPVS